MKFVDTAKIYVAAGDGGNGCVSFRREKYVPRGGPDGGDGGDGGSVYLIGKKNLVTLYDLHIKPHYKAGRGAHGKGKTMNGRTGADIYIPVPPGVVVMNSKGTLGEILHHGEILLVAQGGKGGRGNQHFVSSVRRAPRIAEKGAKGEEKTLHLELKLISDIGLVGFPNSGKSTLLKALTNARPKIADYPFTTLNPNLGILKSTLKNIVIADMPGIIEGAHHGRGLGLQFLRHIERTNLLVMVIDVSSCDALNHHKCLLNEFSNYSEALLEKPRIVVFNKVDLVKTYPRHTLKEKVFYVSALKGEGIDALMEFLAHENKV